MINDGNKTVIGNPVVKSAKVVGEIVKEGRGEKIIVFKMKRRKNYRRTRGHRQTYTSLKSQKLLCKVFWRFTMAHKKVLVHQGMEGTAIHSILALNALAGRSSKAEA